MIVRAGFEPLFSTLTGEIPRKPMLDALCGALAQQISRRGPGSDLAAAELKGIRAAQLARVRS